MGTYDNRRARFAGGPKTASKKLSHQLRAAAARIVLLGFPVEQPFKSRAEVDAYFADAPDSIQCLLCGRRMRTLGLHLRSIHGVSGRSYKETYGIQLRRGLSCLNTRNEKSRIGIESVTPEKMRRMREWQPLAAASLRGKKMPKAPGWLRGEATARFLAINERDIQLSRDDFESVLAIISNGSTQAEALAQCNISATSWFAWRRSNPDFDRRFRETWDALPIPVRARAQRLGDSFVRELKQLWDSGVHNDYEISELLCVSVMTINHHTKAWRRALKPVVI